VGVASEGTTSGPRRKKRAGEDDGAKTGSRKQKDLKTGESKKMKRVRFTNYAQRRRSVRFRERGT